MSQLERPFNQFGAFEAPATDTGGSASGTPDSEPTPHEIPWGIDATELIGFLRRDFTNLTIDVYVETKLEQAGLIPVLEQAGILPSDENPNPFSFETEAAEYDQWWEERPDERDAYDQRIDDRADALKLIHIGALLGHMLGDHLYPGRTFPDKGQR